MVKDFHFIHFSMKGAAKRDKDTGMDVHSIHSFYYARIE